jgi:hypothetical protein
MIDASAVGRTPHAGGVGVHICWGPPTLLCTELLGLNPFLSGTATAYLSLVLSRLRSGL